MLCVNSVWPVRQHVTLRIASANRHRTTRERKKRDVMQTVASSCVPSQMGKQPLACLVNETEQLQVTFTSSTHFAHTACYVFALILTNTLLLFPVTANRSGRAIKGDSPGPLVCLECGFESRQRHGCLSLVSVVCC